MNTSPAQVENEIDLPTPTFDDLPLCEEVRRAVDEMGYVNPTPVQTATWGPAAEGRDIIVQSRTGTGKTAAFGIPLIDRLVRPEPRFQALVLAPTRELALQSTRELAKLGKHRGTRTAAVYGGAPMQRQVAEIAAGAQVVSGTPGRVLDHLRRGTIDPSSLRVLILDEADEMLSMGFAKELNAIMELLPAKRQTMLFSATVDDEVQRIAQRHMHDPLFIGLSSDQIGAEGITHFVYLVSGKARAQDLIRILEIDNPESALIFCNLKSETERVAAALTQAGFDADWLNGDLPQSEREKVMARIRCGELRFMVATDVAARGIDLSHVTHVVNYSFPEAVEQYIHRTGRTGRAGRTGTAISLVSPPELGSLYYLRLQYKIVPIERSLPTSGDQRTRLEVDRVALLDEAFPSLPNEVDRAVAQRLLTHPDMERLVGGLLAAFFGSRGSAEQVNEEAAAARRNRTSARPPASSQPEPAVTASDDVPSSRDAPATDGQHAESNDGGESDEPAREDMTRLYVSLGRRDGVRAGDINQILRERCEIGRADIGRIRVREKHTFVDVLTSRVELIVSTLDGQQVKDRQIVVEPARSAS